MLPATKKKLPDVSYQHSYNSKFLQHATLLACLQAYTHRALTDFSNSPMAKESSGNAFWDGAKATVMFGKFSRLFVTAGHTSVAPSMAPNTTKQTSKGMEEKPDI